MSAPYAEYVCPRECGFVAYVRIHAATHVDPAYPDTDPPDECPICGADMADAEGEPSLGPEPDPDAEYDRDR